MFNFKLKPHLGIFFIIAVIIPAVILGIIAGRAVNREELYIEKQLERTLLAEVEHTVFLLNKEIENIQKELNNSVNPVRELSSSNGVYSLNKTNFKETFSQWQKVSNLVEIPFFLSASNEILWPDSSQPLTEKESAFLNSNIDFFKSKINIPVYKNIALAYRKQIIGNGRDFDARDWGYTGKERKNNYIVSSPEAPSITDLSKDEKTGYYGDFQGKIGDKKTTFQEVNGESFLEKSQINKDGFETDTKEGKLNEKLSQQALTSFKKSPEVRKRVYESAKQKGEQIFTRNVRLPQEEAKKDKIGELEKQESIFVSELLPFKKITEKGEYGIIPRFINEEFTLLFWKKDKENGYIAGCVLNKANFKERILRVLPDVYSSTRIFTILDDNGLPLITAGDEKIRDWRKPFVASEISEILPHWEVVSYLTDPQFISSKAHFMAAVLWTLILILFISIVSGGGFILQILHNEIILAEKKTTFVTNVSHELKTPLTSIRMFAEILKEGRQPDETKKKKYLDIMVSETERLTQLINNVLDFSKINRGKKSYTMNSIDIILLCKNVWESEKVRLEDGKFKVNFIADISKMTVIVDEESIKQVILNLLSNAEKYSQDDKEIELEITRVDEYAIINIKDRGIGISAHHRKKIFKEFYRVNDSVTSNVQGTGLGLAISKKIIAAHKGEIVYFPRDGGGSVFQIKLPIESDY